MASALLTWCIEIIIENRFLRRKVFQSAIFIENEWQQNGISFFFVKFSESCHSKKELILLGNNKSNQLQLY